MLRQSVLDDARGVWGGMKRLSPGNDPGRVHLSIEGRQIGVAGALDLPSKEAFICPTSICY